MPIADVFTPVLWHHSTPTPILKSHGYLGSFHVLIKGLKSYLHAFRRPQLLLRNTWPWHEVHCIGCRYRFLHFGISPSTVGDPWEKLVMIQHINSCILPYFVARHQLGRLRQSGAVVTLFCCIHPRNEIILLRLLGLLMWHIAIVVWGAPKIR